MVISFLSGGTGTPKLLQGFREFKNDDQLAVICNSGDDYLWNGLYVCPDLDTVYYLFANKLDLDKFWGLKNESFHTLEALKLLNADDTWFNVGDQDLGLHIYRTLKMKSMTLTQVMKLVSKAWNIQAEILPMTNDTLQSKIVDRSKSYHFQEYFVKHRTEIDVDKVVFEGNKEQTTEEVKSFFQQSESIIIGPSNPITSIGPFLAIREIRELLMKYRDKIIAVSPIVGNSAFSGPTTKLMKSMGIENSVLGLSKHYSKYISKLIIDTTDSSMVQNIADYDIEAITCNIELKTQNEKENLARTILDFI